MLVKGVGGSDVLKNYDLYVAVLYDNMKLTPNSDIQCPI